METKNLQHLLIQTYSGLLLDLVKIIQEYMSELMSELEDCKTSFILECGPIYTFNTFVGLDIGFSLLIHKSSYYQYENDDSGDRKIINTHVIEKANKTVNVRINSVDANERKLIEDNKPIQHFEITNGFQFHTEDKFNLKFSVNGYLWNENGIALYNNSSIPTNTMVPLDEGFHYYDSTKGDNHMFVLFRDTKNQGQYKFYTLSNMLDIICVLPMHCDRCKPYMCQICAVGNIVYFLCRTAEEHGKPTIRKSTLMV